MEEEPKGLVYNKAQSSFTINIRNVERQASKKNDLFDLENSVET